MNNGLYGASPNITPYLDYAVILDQKAQGTNGGTFTSGAWRTRDLNTIAADTGSFVTLLNNQIILMPGTYRCSISCVAYKVKAHRARLFSLTRNVAVAIGMYSNSDNNDWTSSNSNVIGRFTLNQVEKLEVQHRCNSTYATSGFGLAQNYADTPELYVVVELWREVNY